MHTDVAPIAEDFVRRLLHETDPLEAIGILSSRWGVRTTLTDRWFGLSRPEHDVEMVLIYVGEVGNGGHTQFFSNRGGEICSRVRAAVREIGLVELGVTLDAACALFPGGQVPTDRADVDRLFDAWDDERFANFGPLDERVWKSPVYVRLLEYLREHESEVLRPERGLGVCAP